MKLYTFLVMTVFFLASCNEKEEPQPKQQTNVMSAYKALRSYWEHHDVLPKPETLTDEEIFLNLEKKVAGHIQWGLSQADAEVRELAEFAKNYRVSYNPDNRIAYIRDSDDQVITITEFGGDNAPDVVFQSYEVFKWREMPSHFLFDHASKRVFLTHLNWPKRFERAVFFHELFHAKLHADGKSFPKEESASEEILAHGLEYRILDIMSDGEYSRLVKEVALSLPDAEITDQINSITFAQLKRLDEAIAVPKAGSSQMNAIYSQHILCILMEATEAKGGSMSEKYGAFRAVNKRLTAMLLM